MKMKTRKNSPSPLLPILLLLLLPASLLRASDNKPKPYALIFGTVYGADERPAYGVKIKIRRAEQKKAKWELVSDHAGEFAQRVPAGEADYVISADGAPEVKVHVDKDERVDVSVHLPSGGRK
jgi:hypothetical protein